MKKVSIIDPVGGKGGMDYYDHGLCLGLKSVGYKSYFFTCNETKPLKDSFIVSNFVFGNIWQKSKIFKLVLLFAGYIKAFIISKRNNIGLIHFQFFHLGFQNVMVLWIAKKIFNFSAIVTLHDVDSLRINTPLFLQNMAFKLVDQFIVHNNFSCKELLSKLNDQNKISVIPHGDYNNFVDSLPYMPKINSKLNLLFFGQIKKVKGLEILLEALYNLKNIASKFKLTIAGKPWGIDRQNYLNLIKEYELEDMVVTNFNYIPNEEISKYFKNCDLVVLPYKKIYQSGVLLLAMSYGRAVLCSDLEPFKEIIKDNKSGYIFKSEDVLDLAKKLEYIYNNKSNITIVAENANKLLQTTYNWKTIGGLTKKVYDKY